jgi:type 1 glutamine amidotransferase
MKRVVFTLVVLALVTAVGPARPDTARHAAAERGRLRVLMFVGGCCHDMKNLPEMLKKNLEATGDFQVTITEDRAPLATLSRDKTDIALFYTQGGSLTPEQEKGLTSFVASGGAYAGIHCASDSFSNSDAYWNLVGGRFTGHGSGTFTVHVTVPWHEVMRGVSDFEITDETYNHAFHKDAKILVLARRAKDSAPTVWVREYGKGRVFYTGLGHGKEAWENPAFQKIVLNGLYWAARREQPGAQRSARVCKPGDKGCSAGQ